jgi:hypothetical protein
MINRIPNKHKIKYWFLKILLRFRNLKERQLEMN